MRSLRRLFYAGWLLLHLLLVALVCAHETFSLVEEQLRAGRTPSDSAPWKRLQESAAGASFASPRPGSFFRRIIVTYLNLSGTEVGYGYFAPNVPETHALVFEFHYPDGHVEYESPVIASHEGELRLTSVIEQIGRTGDEAWRKELIKRLARFAWNRHPAAVSVRAFFGSMTPPTLSDYRSGQGERVFTCQYVYDFEDTVRREKAPRR